MVSETFKNWLIGQYESNKKELLQRVDTFPTSTRYVITCFFSDQMKPVMVKYDRQLGEFIELGTSVITDDYKEEECIISLN